MSSPLRYSGTSVSNVPTTGLSTFDLLLPCLRRVSEATLPPAGRGTTVTETEDPDTPYLKTTQVGGTHTVKQGRRCPSRTWWGGGPRPLCTSRTPRRVPRDEETTEKSPPEEKPDNPSPKPHRRRQLYPRGAPRRLGVPALPQVPTRVVDVSFLASSNSDAEGLPPGSSSSLQTRVPRRFGVVRQG